VARRSHFEGWLRLLTIALPSLVAPLRSGVFARSELSIGIGGSIEEMLALARTERPQVIVMVAGAMPPARQRAVTGELRSRLSGTPQLLLLAVTNATSFDDTGLYDATVRIEQIDADLERVLVPHLELALRRSPRRPVSIPARVDAPGQKPLAAHAVDLSSGGLGLVLAAPLDSAAPVQLTLHRTDGRRVTLQGRPSWRVAPAGHRGRAGLRFVDAPTRSLAALQDLAFWAVTGQGRARVVRLHGPISGTTHFTQRLLDAVVDSPVLDLSGVSAIEDGGLLRWLDFINALPHDVTLRLRKVSLHMARQMLQWSSMTWRCTVESVQVAFHCKVCDLTVEELVRDGDTGCRSCLLCDEQMLPGVTLFVLGDCTGRTPTRPFRIGEPPSAPSIRRVAGAR
jgi:hypothetical protein